MAGFSNVRDPTLDTLPADAPIYYYGGHGEDVCDPVTHELRVETVPENCIYITSGECGLQTFTPNITKFITLFRDPSERVRTLLRYPYLEENLAGISRQTGIGIDSLHIHLPGSPYVVSRIRPPLSWNNSTHFGMFLSGISEKRLLEQVPPSVQGFIWGKEKSYFKIGSLGRLNDPEPRNELFRKLQTVFASDALASLFIGDPGTENLLNRMFEGQDTVTRKDIGRYMKELEYSMKTETFLGLFQASVVPTQDQVRTILKEKTTALDDGIIYGVDIRNVSRLLSEPEIVSSDLMRRYPGIHYNVVCRSLAKGCEVDPSVRRAVSNADEQRRREALRGVGAPAERAGGRRRRTRRNPRTKPRTTRRTRRR